MFFSIAAYLLAPFYLAALLWRGRGEPGYWRGLSERFGFGAPLPAPVWLHAASAGEVQAAAILIGVLRQHDASQPILVTVTTAVGLARARTLFASQPVTVRYVPLDLHGAVRRFLRRVRPRLVIVLETEIWPNMLRACATANVPVAFVSARLSERSVGRYQRLGGRLRDLMAGVALVGAQTASDARRFGELGVRPDRITVTGNLKADFTAPDAARAGGLQRRARYGIERSVWVAGSTHDIEEQQVLAAHRAVCQRHPGTLLILVPRQPRRFQAVAEWLRGEQVRFVTESGGQAVDAHTQVLLVDRVGVLLECYAAADLAFVGGSLVVVGGHNLLEPASFGRPVLTGPHHGNGREILAALLAADGARVVHDGLALGTAVAGLLENADARQRMGARAAQVVADSRGAAARVAAALARLMAGRAGG